MRQQFEILGWDSNFFGVKTAEIKKNLLVNEKLSTCLNGLAAANVELAYYTSDKTLGSEVSNSSYSFQLVDKKVPIKKQLFASFPLHEKISFYNDSKPTKELIDLSYRAGNFSRFLSDYNIKSEQVKELYEIWITKSIQKKMASEVLVFKEKDEIKGFVTLLINPPHGQTPLFAVSRDSEGKGISFALMRAADSVLYERGCSYYTSATQADNKAAVTVFKRHGFDIGSIEYVYHLWKKTNNK